MSEPLITKDFLSFCMKDTFPGCKLKIKDRMGGVVMSMAIWHYDLSMSLTTTQVALVDVVGQVNMTLTYLPRELKAEKSTAPIILRRVSTTDPERVKQYLAGVKAYMKGIVAAIHTATTNPDDREADIFSGGDDE